MQCKDCGKKKIPREKVCALLGLGDMDKISYHGIFQIYDGILFLINKSSEMCFFSSVTLGWQHKLSKKRKVLSLSTAFIFS
jgi:hypothetical protein